jgi:hypothetical protein
MIPSDRVKRLRWVLLLVSVVLILNIIATVGGLTIPFYADI